MVVDLCRQVELVVCFIEVKVIVVGMELSYLSFEVGQLPLNLVFVMVVLEVEEPLLFVSFQLTYWV